MFGRSLKMFPLVYETGKIDYVPMENVHINTEGVASIPDTCFPIIMQVDMTQSGSGSWGYCAVYYHTESRHNKEKSRNAIVSFGRNTNDDITVNAEGKSSYVPIQCIDREDLLNTKLTKHSNLNARIKAIKYFCWADKSAIVKMVGVIRKLFSNMCLAGKWSACYD